MGRKSFSQAEGAAIRRLLQSPSRDQAVRRRLRNMGFYISDWSSTPGDFSVSDFDRLVTRGAITIERVAEAAGLQVGPASQGDRTPPVRDIPRHTTTTRPTATRTVRDEHYIVDLCDALLGGKALRQYRGLRFLAGDTGMPLPVDAYYPDLKLVVEYRERQHSEAVPLFDKRMTASGVYRDEQRRLYDQRRRELLPKHGIELVELDYSEFAHGSRKRLLRDAASDLAVLRAKLTRWLVETA